LTSISADSEKLFREFDAIRKLRLFAGLGRFGLRKTRAVADSGGGKVVAGVKQSATPSSAMSTGRRRCNEDF